MMFAEANVDPNTGWQVILIIGMLVAIISNFMVILRSNNAQKREVSFGFVPASKEQFDAHVTATRQGFTDMNDRMDEFGLKRERDLNALHDKINEVRDDVTFIRATISKGRDNQ